MDIDANTQEETTPKPAPTPAEKEPITYQTTPTADEVLSEIHEATMQYINCGDPTESAARRQRVLISEARGDVENAAAGIIAAAASNHNPITQTEPPILQNTKATIETGAPSRAPPGTLLLMGPTEGVDHNEEMPPHGRSENKTTSGKKRGRPARLQYKIVSPKATTGASSKKRIMSMIQNSPGRQYTTTRADRHQSHRGG